VSGDRASDELGAGGGREVERVIFFSDAVMAIAITLLVIELHVPETLDQTATDAELRSALSDLGQSFLSVMLSFMVIAVWWFGHNRLYRTITRTDGPLLLLNFVFLAAIAFIPFPTTLIGRFVNLPSAVMLYAATNFVAGSAILAMRWHADRRGFLDIDTPLERRRRMVAAALAPLVFAVSIPIAAMDATTGALSWILMVPATLAVRWWFARAMRREAAAAIQADGS
jgi:TMEM175 potassium channel family protein